MAQANNYTELEELGEIEWIQHRPETYIGTTNDPTHLFEEVFDNALDEVLGDYAKNIIIKIKDGECSISDDGRGFPVASNEDGIPYPIRACTKLYTSGKFNKNVKAYEMSAGLNGIGLVAVCALSDTMTIVSYRDGKAHQFQFKTDFDKSIINTDVMTPIASNGIGTTIIFRPSKKIFRSVKFNFDYIKERIQLAKTLTDANIRFFYDGKEVEIKIDKDKLIESFFENNDDYETYKVKVKSNNQKFNLYFFYDMNKNEPRFKGSTNILPVHRGTHIKWARDVLATTLMSCMPNNKILSKNDYIIGIRCFVETNIKEPRFSGQTKGELDIDVKRFSIFEKQLIERLINVFKTEMDITALYDRFIEYKQRLSAKKILKKRKVRKFTSNLLDSVKYGKGTYLFIVEGDSAAGSLIDCRDRNKHAVYTLTGKSMPNVDVGGASKIKRILGNKTVLDMFNVFEKDLSMEPMEDVSKIRYENVVITTDPDIDGYHITIMMMKFFNKFFPKLIDEGRLLLAQVPLYSYTDSNKKFIPVFDNDEAKVLMESGKKLTRHKGLGEFDPEELEVVLFKVGNYIVLTKNRIEEIIEQENIIETSNTISDLTKQIINNDETVDDFKF